MQSRGREDKLNSLLIVWFVDPFARGAAIGQGFWFVSSNQKPAKLGGKMSMVYWPLKS